MKKNNYLGFIVIMTTLLGAMVLSSCKHDIYYDEGRAEQEANDKYAAAFEKAFGHVAPTVDWGFSSKHIYAAYNFIPNRL